MTRLIAVFEFRSAVAKRSFWLVTILFPVLILALSLGTTLAGDMGAPSLEEALAPSGAPRGYVDEGGLIRELPPGVTADTLPSFATVGEAEAALGRGEVSGFYIIPADYVESGELTLVQGEFTPLSPDTGGPLMEYVVAYALTGDVATAAALVEPTPDVEVTALAGEGEPAGAAGDGAGSFQLVPFAVLFVLFFVITTSGGYLLQSVTREKENRTAEVLLVTVRPRQLMLGKVVGLGGVALVQIAVWVGGGLLVLSEVTGMVDLGELGVSGWLLFWLLAFLLLGYVAYGSILAALGTLVPSQREGGQFMFVVLLPLLVPLWFNYVLIDQSDGALALALSLFPLSAPVAMTTRLAAGDVPLWQPVVALAGLALTAYLFVLLGARVFSAGTLLSSESLSWQRLRSAVRTAVRTG